MEKTYDDEIVPDPKKLPHIITCSLILHHLGEQSDEVRRAEV